MPTAAAVCGGISLIVFIGVISYPLFIYSWIKLKSNHSADYFAIRGTELIIIQSVIMFISANIITPIGVLYEDLEIITIDPILFCLMETIDIAIILAIFLILPLRIWMVNYRHALQLVMVNDTWKKQLSLFSVDQESFYVKHKSTLGSYSFMKTAFGAFYAVICCVFIAGVFRNPEDQTMNFSILALLCLIIIIAIVIIWCKYPKFKDYCCIRQELKEQFIFLLFVEIIGILFIIAMNSSDIEGTSSFSQFVLVILCDGLLYSLIIRVIKLNEMRNTALEKCLGDIVMDDEKISFDLDDIIKNENAYQEFMNALVQFSCLSLYILLLRLFFYSFIRLYLPLFVFIYFVYDKVHISDINK